MNERLIQLYQQMAALTLPECQACPVPLSCCSAEYCEVTIEWARREWGVVLEPTGHPTLPLMGPQGCTAAPHLRPICTMHTCQVSSLGYKPGDPTWTQLYFDVRKKIDVLEVKRLQQRKREGKSSFFRRDDT